MYFNPCYAGCQEFREANGAKMYFNCSCIVDESKDATSGICGMECQSYTVFAILIFLQAFFTFMAVMPSIVATLRYVQRKHRSLAIGIDSMIVRYEDISNQKGSRSCGLFFNSFAYFSVTVMGTSN